MAGFIYSLCALTALFCALLLLQAYRRSGYRLLLWGGICFLGFTLNNAVLIADKLLLPFVNLFAWRLVTALISMLVLLYGLIWDAE